MHETLACQFIESIGAVERDFLIAIRNQMKVTGAQKDYWSTEKYEGTRKESDLLSIILSTNGKKTVEQTWIREDVLATYVVGIRPAETYGHG